MKNRNHIFVSVKVIPYQVCRKCGLIALKNKRTRKAINKSCPGTPDEDD